MLVKKILDEEGASVVKKGQETSLQFTSQSLKDLQNLQLLLSEKGYCSLTQLKSRKGKKDVFYSFSTFFFSSFNALYETFADSHDTHAVLTENAISIRFANILSEETLNHPQFKVLLVKSLRHFDEHPEDVGGLLGDLTLSHYGSLGLDYSHIHMAAAVYIYSKWSRLGYCTPKELKTRVSMSKNKQTTYLSVRKNTFALKSFRELHSMFYRKATLEEQKGLVKKRFRVLLKLFLKI